MSNKQYGMTFISLAALLSAGGFVLMVFFQMWPSYLNNFKIKDAMAATESMPSIETMSESEIRQSLQKRFNIGYVEGIDTNKDIQIIKKGTYLSVKTEYEVIKPIVGNVSVLMYFNEGFEKGKI